MIKLLDDEKIILTQRRHWFVVASEGAFVFLLGVVPFAGLVASYIIFPQALSFLWDYWLFILFYGALWLHIMWVAFAIFWTNYYLDIILITNKRVVDIEQFGLFARDVVDLRLDSIQDIKVEVMGIIPSLLKMGDLHIQTAGQSKEIVFKGIPDPNGVKHIISKCHDQLMRSRFYRGGSESINTTTRTQI